MGTLLFFRNTFLFFLIAAIPGFGGLPNHILSTDDGTPSACLLEVLDAFQVPHNGSWGSIREETQKRWLQKKERWEIDPCEDANPQSTYALFSKLYMAQPILPEKKRYDYAVILGGTVQSVRKRFWFLKKAWDDGVRFPILVVLTGDRPLAVEIENASTLLDPRCCPYPFREDWVFDGSFPQNETEMTQLVFDQLDLPHEWRSMSILFIDTPRKQDGKRPNTADTFAYWLALQPDAGSVLSVSNAPFAPRQDLVAKKILPPIFEVETIGDGFTLDEYRGNPRGPPLLLDELARWIYELCPP